ncbi:MAG: sigma-70 family RNA polymerase sigma factor [bacterium]
MTEAEPPSEVTRLLEEARIGNQQSLQELIPLVYEELRRIASSNLRNAGPKQTMFTTDLVHEAFLKLTGSQNLKWESRLHFFNIAATSMRQILVDHARARNAEKRGGMLTRVTFDSSLPVHIDSLDDIAALDEAMRALEKVDARACRIIELRFFGGLTNSEIAGMLSLSERTVKRDWEFAKAWLFRVLTLSER